MPNNFQLPAGSEVLAKSTAKLRMSGEKFTVFKIYDKIKDSDFRIAFDSNKKQVDFAEYLKKDIANYHKKFGKIHPTLYKIAEKADVTTKINILVWVKSKDDEPEKTSFNEGSIRKLTTEISRFRKSKFSEISNISEKISKDLDIKINKISRSFPAFFTTVDKIQIEKLSKNELISGLLYHDPTGIDDLSTSLSISNADDVITSGFSGKDIKVAVWEGGPDDTSNLVIEAFKQVGNRTSDHARLVSGVIKNIEKDKPHGYAPDCKLFSANDSDFDGLEWAVEDKGCSVINQSFHRSEEQTEGELSTDDIAKDYMIYHYPYPTIIQAAGNTGQASDPVGLGENEYVNHKGFNSLAIGNHNDSATAMAGGSTYRNPDCPHGDRELPELSANGTAVSAVGLSMGGTSFSSPAVTGSVALLQSVKSVLKIWPEGSRALLLAGATQNVRDNTWKNDTISGTDARDGSGALNIEESVNIAKNRKRKDNNASRRGWDIGRLDSGDFKRNRDSNFAYKIRVPRSGAKHVKVALTWNSKVDDIFWFHISSELKLDLDLRIIDENGEIVAHSSSYDNSYEIAEFDAKAGKVYTIKIRKFSGDDWTYFGIAWTVV